MASVIVALAGGSEPREPQLVCSVLLASAIGPFISTYKCSLFFEQILLLFAILYCYCFQSIGKVGLIGDFAKLP